MVLLLRREADGTPLLLDGLHLLGSLVPLLIGFEFIHIQGLELVYECLLLLEVLVLLSVEFVEIGLVFLIDYTAGLFESVPEFLAQFASHRTNLSPLVVELLQSTVSLYNVWILLQFFGRLAEEGLHLQVLLEVEVAKLDINLHEVIETLLVLLVVLPDLLVLGSRHRTNGLPLGLQFAHFLEVVHNICCLCISHLLHLSEDILLAQQILLLLFLELLLQLCTTLLILRQQLAELLLQLIDGRQPVLQHLARCLRGLQSGFLLCL